MMSRGIGGVGEENSQAYELDGLQAVDARMISILPLAHMQITVYVSTEYAAELISEGRRKAQ
jgi:hypothetical protein